MKIALSMLNTGDRDIDFGIDIDIDIDAVDKKGKECHQN
jgi:hypothetical protein